MSLDRPSALVDADPDAGTYRGAYRYPTRPPSVAVALALVENTDSDAVDLVPPCEAASGNADALDDAFDPAVNETRHDGRVTFDYLDHTVTVTGRRRIVIQSPPSQADSPPGHR